MRGVKQRAEGLGTADILEEGIEILRTYPFHLLTTYYIGSLPFVLGFLYFWADMSRGAFAHRHSAGAAFFMSVMFIWMKCWQTVFARQIMDCLTGAEPGKWRPGKLVSMISQQTFFHAAGLLLVPLAAILTFPFGWVYAFFQNVTVVGNGETDSGKVYEKARKHSMLFQKQNHTLLFVLYSFGTIVFVNLLIVLYFVPQFLHTFLGIETIFTRTGWNPFNTTFLATTVSITHLTIDPLVKTVYVLRSFYGESLKTGEDLKAELTRLSMAKAAVAISVILICQGIAIKDGYADQGEGKAYTATAVSVSEIDRSINNVANKSEYSWRMKREKTEESGEKGAFAEFIDAVLAAVKDGIKYIADRIAKLFEWFYEHILKRMKLNYKPKQDAPGLPFSVQALLFVLFAIAACSLAIFAFRRMKQHTGSKLNGHDGSMPLLPDLASENIVADQLPANRWLEMGREFIKQGNMRFAMRAFYLANLSHLADQGVIMIAAFKSNRDYEHELQRKKGSLPALVSAFSENSRIFDRTWYGMHNLTVEIMNDFQKNQDRIFAFDQKK